MDMIIKVSIAVDVVKIGYLHSEIKPNMGELTKLGAE
jgi:hypothetical protein